MLTLKSNPNQRACLDSLSIEFDRFYQYRTTTKLINFKEIKKFSLKLINF